MQLTDPYHLKARRRKMVEALALKGIHDQRVLKAMEQLPRHFFVESIFAEKAYEDKALPIEVDQTISQPFTVAFQSALLDVQTNHKILEIGTGSGYQAAVLALLGAKVFTVERQSVLYHKTKTLLETLGMHAIKCYHKDGTNGLSTQQPYDGIIVTAGAPVVPEALKQQLKIGGRLVIPVGASTQTMLLITRIDKNQFTQEEKGTFQFVPFLKGIQS